MCYDGLYFDLFCYIWPILIATIALIITIKFPYRYNSEKMRKQIIASAIIVLLLSTFAVSKVVFSIASPEVGVYQGEFVSFYNDGSAYSKTPPSMAYRFTDGEGVRQFNLNNKSKQKIWPRGFIEGQEYIIYYKEGFSSDIIVKVEIVV